MFDYRKVKGLPNKRADEERGDPSGGGGAFWKGRYLVKENSQLESSNLTTHLVTIMKPQKAIASCFEFGF